MQDPPARMRVFRLASMGPGPRLRMATVLATSSQKVVKKRAIYKRRLRETPPLAALLAKQQSRAAPEVEVGILQGGSGCS